MYVCDLWTLCVLFFKMLILRYAYFLHLMILLSITMTVCWASALPPESSDKYNIGTKEYSKDDEAAITEPNIEDASHERVGKSVGFTRKSTPTPAVFTKPQTFVNPYPQSSDITDVGEEIVQRETYNLSNNSNLSKINISKFVESLPNASFNDTPNNHANTTKASTKVENTSTSDFSDNPSTVKSTIREILITYSNNETSIHSEVRSTKGPFDNTTVSSTNDTLTIHDEVKDGNITDKPLSLETTINEQHILSSLHIVEPTKGKITLASASIEDQPSYGSLDTAAVAGISFAALVLLALTGATSFVLYRRRYLNKPQTLNDKCSNADSSGYIDDSTIRENSEEMYSLDNDSFLNSLEAMTIQNYWTDTVKHTKL